MTAGNCLRVQMLEAEIFAQRVSFWKFPFLAWQSLRVLASRTKNMCAGVLDPCFIVTKGIMIWWTPLESQATVVLPMPTFWILGSELAVSDWAEIMIHDSLSNRLPCVSHFQKETHQYKPVNVRSEASGVSGRDWAQITLHSPDFLVALLSLPTHLLCFLCASHSRKSFVGIFLFKPHNYSMREVLLGIL